MKMQGNQLSLSLPTRGDYKAKADYTDMKTIYQVKYKP